MTPDPRMEALPVIRQRLLSENAGNNGADIVAENLDAIGPLMSSLLPDGSWKDICYDSPELKDWPPGMHLRRLLAMARAWFQPASPGRGDPAILEAALRGLDRWYELKPRSQNWWWNQIGAPMTLGELLLHLRDTCDKSYKRKTAKGQTLSSLASIFRLHHCSL